MYVGAARLELATSWSQTRRDNQLRYAPNNAYNELSGCKCTIIFNPSNKKYFLFDLFILSIHSAVREGFEPSVPVAQYDSLANCSFRPLRHLTQPFFKGLQM